MIQSTIDGDVLVENRRASHCIEFMYWEECPSHERALQLLREALREQPLQAEILLHRVETDEEAEELGFPGSPTIRVDGADIAPSGDRPAGLSCRAYRTDTGRISPLPPKSAILDALRNARRDDIHQPCCSGR